jgi:hypothetical protein
LTTYASRRAQRNKLERGESSDAPAIHEPNDTWSIHIRNMARTTKPLTQRYDDDDDMDDDDDDDEKKAKYKHSGGRLCHGTGNNSSALSDCRAERLFATNIPMNRIMPPIATLRRMWTGHGPTPGRLVVVHLNGRCRKPFTESRLHIPQLHPTQRAEVTGRQPSASTGRSSLQGGVTSGANTTRKRGLCWRLSGLLRIVQDNNKITVNGLCVLVGVLRYRHCA